MFCFYFFKTTYEYGKRFQQLKHSKRSDGALIRQGKSHVQGSTPVNGESKALALQIPVSTEEE